VVGKLFSFGRGNSEMLPSGVMRPIRLPGNSVNQRFPSGPVVMLSGPPDGFGTGNSLRLPATTGLVGVGVALLTVAVPPQEASMSGAIRIKANGHASLRESMAICISPPLSVRPLYCLYDRSASISVNYLAAARTGPQTEPALTVRFLTEIPSLRTYRG
jgi:hypothetical protein